MSYERNIRYLDDIKNGEKIGNAGYVKIECVDMECNIHVHITKLADVGNCTRDVYLCGQKDGVLGNVLLQGGRGSLVRKKLSIDDLCEGISYEELERIHIRIGNTRELVCQWKEKTQEAKAQEAKAQETKAQETRAQEARAQEAKAQEANAQEENAQEENVQGAKVQESKMQEINPQEAKKPDSDCQEVKIHNKKVSKSEDSKSENIKPEALQAASEQGINIQEITVQERTSLPLFRNGFQDSKWKQLSAIYPHISPFRDERDYLSIGPGDFVLLPAKYYRLVNNSFLLHGFYDYGHMILARTQKRGEEQFFLGVPGNFHEKNRQAAILYGFESFECRKEPAEEGDYGYFMIRIEL